MSKITKRWLGIALATVLIVVLGIAGFVMASTPDEEPVCYSHGDVNGDGTVNKDDAIYLLYASFPGLGAEFPLQYDGEIDGKGGIDKDDAIYLLYASFPDEAVREEFPLKGQIHSYYDPTWTWEEDGTAEVTFKCGCGSDDHPAGGVVEATVTSEVVEAPTCVKTGTTKLTATVTYNGTEYTDTKTVVTPANDHVLSEKSCTADQECANCDYKVAASGHSFVLLSTTPASCTAAGEEKYKCASCPETNTVVLEQLHHQLTYVENGDIADDAVKCQFIKQYKCSVCSGVFDGTGADDVYTKHTYVTTLTTEASCSQEGLKTTVCSVCGDLKGTETLAKDASKHAWDGGVESEGKITFTCGGCQTPRTEVVAAQDGAVDTTDLNAETGVNLGNASVALDQNALDSVKSQRDDNNISSSNIIIKVEEKDKNSVGLDAEQAKQIRGDTVYDFTMTYDDANKTPVTDFGSGLVTVTLPYELEAGEDIDSIVIWYIDGNGDPRQVAGAVYSNGFVTFQTSHFSYYTVTRLTPAERCARLGSHIEITQTKAPTCTEDGYDMTICQRCATVTSYTARSKTGHSYTDSEQAATCDKEGKLTRTCTCGHIVTKTIPALGHKMVIDEKSVEATCNAAGKTVKVCERGCGYTTEETTAQLTHDYAMNDEKSVKATCSAGGYDLYVCSLCKNEEKRNETAPLGHNYPEGLVQWVWSEDNTAVATLVCENDESHTKVLEAVVTKNTDKSQNTSCLGSGSTVYDAAVGYNNKTYTSYKEITVAAPGHKPGVAWSSTEGQHYHLCTVCNEKVDAAAHSWNEGTVTKAPTCNADGSKTVECTVCAYSKTQTLEATGEHSYVNGVCSVCGFTENSCRHMPTNKTVIDSASHGLCAGTVIYKYSCDCGLVAEYEEVSTHCSYGKETAETTKDEYGFTSTMYTAACEDCGLVMKSGYLQEVDSEKCYRTVSALTEYSKDGAVIATISYEVYGSGHPAVTVVDTVTVEEKGLCGTLTVTFSKCICGKYTAASVNGPCQWGWAVGNGAGEEYSYGMCINCGATQDIEHVYTNVQGEPCKRVRNDTVTISYGDKELLTYEESYELENHKQELTGYELMGKTCTDGVYATVKCAGCGQTEEGFIRYHEPLLQELVDISQYNLCSQYLVKTSCVCPEKYSDNHLLNEDGTGCSMEWAWDKDTQSEFRMCYKCGVRVFEDITYGEKGENCLCTTDTVTSYVNEEGQVLFTATGHGDVNYHNIKTEGSLVEGATDCLDGIFVREYCTDCAYEFTYENNWHEMFPTTTYDLSALGSCIKSITLYRCPCGVNTSTNYDGDCRLDWVEDNTDSQEQYKCSICGLTETINYSYPESDDPCLVRVVRLYTYSKEGVETTVRFSQEEENWNHDTVYQLELAEGATNCNDGFTGTGACRTCGKEHTISGYWHNTYKTRHEAVDNGKMCGTVEIMEYSCACGENSNSNIVWDEANRCHFTGGEYSEDLGAWVYTCGECGSYYYQKSTQTPVEGSTCDIRYDYTYKYFDKDGNLLFERSSYGIGSNHNYTASFQDAQGNAWTGESCSEGFYVVNTCSKCGETFKEDRLYTECETFVCETRQIYDSADICGPITVVRGKCPCGARTTAHVENDCEFNHYGYDDNGDQIAKCVRCELMQVHTYETIRREDECSADARIKYDFFLGDETVAQVDESFVIDAHLWVYTYDGKPASCEEGWGATIRCFACGKDGGRTSGNYYHSRNIVAYHDLSDYGMCKGYIEAESCACGQSASWSFTEADCEWEYISEEDGVNTYYCEFCETYCYRTENAQRGEECRFIGTERLQFVRNDETVLDVTVNESYTRHETTLTGAVLVTPGTSCEAGVELVYTCKYCSYSHRNTTYGHHTVQTDKVESACGTTFTREECLCGEESNVYRTENCNFSTLERNSTGDALNGSETEHRKCADCGMEVIMERSWTKSATSCKQLYEGTYTILYNGQTWGLEFAYNVRSHEYGESVFSLEPGATSCDDGLVHTHTCKLCGETSTVYTYSGHYMNRVEALDLKLYGATCGGELIKYACPCGATGRYSLSEDASCELQQQPTDLWITDVLNNVSNVGTNGTNWFYSEAYTFTCAVTDPACSLQLRMEEYWQVKGCIATEYQCWQYKNADGAWVDIATVPTGECRSYHAYTETTVDTTEGTAEVTGTKYDCACGAYHHTLRYDYADGTYKRTVEAKDTTGKEYHSQVRHTYEYMCVQNNNQLLTKSYNEYVYTDGGSYWEQYVYDYNFDGTCEVTTTYTSSGSSKPSVSSKKHIEGGYKDIYLKDSTCTQPGQWKREHYCAACNEVIKTDYYTTTPHNHFWYNSGEGMYTCGACGLENTNGASEGIIIEDLTAEYGNGTQYVAGYWNKDAVNFVNNVSVIIDGQAQVLAGIEFTEHDEVTAICFDKALADRLAAEAANGAAYELRLNFVATVQGETKEYAITFTNDAEQ